MFTFIPFQETYLISFRSWLAKPHIKQFWQEPESDDELKEKMLVKLPLRGVKPFILEFQERPIGYIQYYDATKIGGGWWENELPGTFGIDLMIGDENLVGAGNGPRILDAFITYLRKIEPKLISIIIDPEPTNTRAIRAFEKSGFKIEKEIITPGGNALLMRWRVTQN